MTVERLLILEVMSLRECGFINKEAIEIWSDLSVGSNAQ